MSKRIRVRRQEPLGIAQCHNGNMPTSQVLMLQHAPWQRPGRILENLEDLGVAASVVDVSRQKKPDWPDFDELAGVVFLGGPMSVADTDKYPGLKAEAKLAKAALSVGKPVLGVGLGHHIVAVALGAKLSTMDEPEIGFDAIKRMDKHDYFSMWNKQMPALHWHRECVGLPAGAQLLARSSQSKVQAYRVGSALCMQFHLEVTSTMFEEWLVEPAMVKGMKKSRIATLREEFAAVNPHIQSFADDVFSGFAARCRTYAQALER